MKLNYICKFCGKVCIRPSGLAIHERTCKLNPERKPIQNHKCNWPTVNLKLMDGFVVDVRESVTLEKNYLVIKKNAILIKSF